MDLTAYLTSIVAVCGIALGAIYLIVNLLGKRLDDIVGHVNARFDDMDRRFDDAGKNLDQRLDSLAAIVDQRFDGVAQRFDGVDRRLDRLEAQNDSIIGAVSDLGQRVTRLETGHA